ncbi:MAG: tRNA (adenosine(37)-N6)-threonylcarbamoyltransferase complex dimerization subunit type 1 TsaB [Emcibacteraceae bacterium]|nr:tRNA (adenosine(37)-N6)-threonylcarbamoyltransferase complex dimerization subunit type 1 TsaB [Emcibacteraceae bacterium]MDG1726281.1 tRNA (adenosine(37)-N6)-threonylcarbamoyltransferase complex dimerization subunit type 1 TsaB [Emcibacteraceae bacterium]
MTNLLALDTTLGACSVALVEDDKVVSKKKEVRARGHVERLLPMVDESMKEAELVMSDLSSIVVTVGPGTFAGVRIGLSAAKGMALALNIPLIPVTSLEALAYEFALEKANFSGQIAVAIDARRGELYFQVFDIVKTNISSLADAEAVPLELIPQKINDNIKIIIGSGAELLGAILTDSEIKFSTKIQHPTAEIIAQLALNYKERETNSDHVKPLYLRAPDAKLPSKNIMPNIKDE